MRVYYNDNEPFVAAWLRNLIAAGHLPTGDVDERSIQEVQPDDLKGYDQCHFFAGIGGWAYALQLAGWDGPVWTGSCPCQPFSAAGKQGGHTDERHLWPAWFRLIRECHPVTIFGEQVSGAVGLGWLDAVAMDLEAADYAVGACILGAHSVGAPHRRQRLYFVADCGAARCGTGRTSQAGDGRDAPRLESPRLRDAGELGHATDARRQGAEPELLPTGQAQGRLPAGPGDAGELADALPAGRAAWRSGSRRGSVAGSGEPGELAEPPSEQVGPAGLPRGNWDAVDWLPCIDGKARPVEPGTFPLAHGAPARVGRLRAYGNAIVPQVAAEFVKAYMACRPR